MRKSQLFSRFGSDVLPRTIRERLERVLADWQAKRADGKLTLAEFIDFTRKAIEEAMGIVAPLADNAAKKALVLEFAGLLFDFFAPKLKFTWFGWIFWLLGDDSLKQRYLEAITVLIEAIFAGKFSK